MSSNRGARAGTTIKLRARFKDDLGDPTTASGIYVHLFDSSIIDITDLTLATVVSGSPTYLGQGIYEYQYSIPDNGPDGIWSDIWTGMLNGQALEVQLSFEVSASGIIEQISETQLYENNIVRVTIASGIYATDGGALEDEYIMEFLTTTSPAYTNIRKVQLAVGGFLDGVENDTIQLGILEGSIEADVLNFRDVKINTAVFNHARREYVTCLASRYLLTNLGTSQLRAKTLDNLHVEYDTNGLRDTMLKLEDCMARWEPQIIAGGGARAVTQPTMVVKGELDPDRPIVSRSWKSTEDGHVSRRIPAANTRQRPNGKRRHVRTYRKRWW